MMRSGQDAWNRANHSIAKKKNGLTVALIVGAVFLAVVLAASFFARAFLLRMSYVSTSGSGDPPTMMGVQVISIQTNTMYPTMSAGDVIFCTPVEDPRTLREGDIITYWTIVNGERVLNTHRITAIYEGGGYLIFGTKGDNNYQEDALTVHESEIVGKYSGYRIPGHGGPEDENKE